MSTESGQGVVEVEAPNYVTIELGQGSFDRLCMRDAASPSRRVLTR